MFVNDFFRLIPYYSVLHQIICAFSCISRRFFVPLQHQTTISGQNYSYYSYLFPKQNHYATKPVFNYGANAEPRLARAMLSRSLHSPLHLKCNGKGTTFQNGVVRLWPTVKKKNQKSCGISVILVHSPSKKVVICSSRISFRKMGDISRTFLFCNSSGRSMQ